MLAQTIKFALSNFTLTFLIIGFVAAAIALIRAPRPLTASVVVDTLTGAFTLWSVAISSLYNGVFHIFFDNMAAAFIGWAPSPFQAEVGFASVGLGVLGLLAYRGGLDYRVAAIVCMAITWLGAAAGHVYQMVTTANYAPGNAGVIFYLDIVIPLLGLLLVGLQHRAADPRSSGAVTTRALQP